MGTYETFLAWVEILNNRTFCANAQNVNAPIYALSARPNFTAEGRRPPNMGLKLTAMVKLMGIEHVLGTLSMTVFEKLPKIVFTCRCDCSRVERFFTFAFRNYTYS